VSVGYDVFEGMSDVAARVRNPHREKPPNLGDLVRVGVPGTLSAIAQRKRESVSLPTSR
jgi:hypothetical protein